MDIFIKLTMKESQKYQIIQKLINKQITNREASKMIGISKRQVQRVKLKVANQGIIGIVHQNRGRTGNRRYTDEFINKILSFYDQYYYDYGPTLAAEKLLELHSIKVSKEWLRTILIKNNRWKVKSRRKPKQRHVWRERRSNYGEMQQFDGSYHKWFEKRGEKCCLLLAVDDATGVITKAKFDQHEGVVPVFKFWEEYGKTNGFPCEIYLDKFSTYKINHKSAQDNKELITQFQRAMNQIGVKLIVAHTPQAKGRVERMNATLQDRLVKELRLKNISTIKEANRFLEKEFIPVFNKKFAVIPKEKANLHKTINKELDKKLTQIFSIQNTRKVMNDYTIMFKNQFFQLEEKQPTTLFKKDTVIIEEHLDKSIKIRLNSKYLKYYKLPKRPKKILNVPLCALTKNKAPWIPPKNHPWRGNENLNNSKNLTISK